MLIADQYDRTTFSVHRIILSRLDFENLADKLTQRFPQSICEEALDGRGQNSKGERKGREEWYKIEGRVKRSAAGVTGGLQARVYTTSFKN